MGRGKKRSGLSSAVATDAATLEAQADALLAGASAPATSAPNAASGEQRMFISAINARIQRKLPDNVFDLDHEGQKRAEGKALGVLSPMDQRKLVRIANEYSGPGRDSIRERAAELLILTNAGFVEDTIRSHEARGLQAEVLRQECRLAMYDAIGRFDHTNGASFLAFAEWRIRGAISEAIRSDSRLVRLKSRASEIADRVQRAIKDFGNQGIELGELTPQMLADKTGDRLERVIEVLPWVTNSYVRLDGPIATKDGEIDVASAIADPLVDVEGEIVDENIKRALQGALGTLSPYEQRVVELYYNLDSSQEIQQSHLFDGVYEDNLGFQYSAEQSVIADRRNRIASGNPDETPDQPIMTATQKELNERYARGELIFKPGTPEARELFELSGVPPTSATIQETLGKTYEKLAPKLESLREFHTYRGDNALEHSEGACEMVREELRKLARAGDGTVYVDGWGPLSLDEIDRLRPGRTAKGGIGRKGALRRVAELTGHVEEDSGRLTFAPEGGQQPRPQAKSTPAKAKTRATAPKPKQQEKAARPADLIQGGFLKAGESLSLLYKGSEYKATLLADGKLQLEDGRVFNALSGAAEAAKGVRADPGWNSWHVERDGQRVSLFDIRAQFRAS